MFTLGALFVADGIVLLGLALWVAIRPSHRSLNAALIGSAATAVAYVMSRTTGLRFLEREAWDGLGIATTIAELSVTLLCIAMLRTPESLLLQEEMSYSAR